MLTVYSRCGYCNGFGFVHPAPAGLSWLSCSACDQVGRVWAPGAPRYGCAAALADVEPGELVTLGNGDTGRVLWHQPRRAKKSIPVTTWIAPVDQFDGVESHRPVAYPSVVGVRGFVSASVPSDDHYGARGADQEDPLLRRAHAAGRLA